MSYIFEALQRAEAERAGGNAPQNAASVVDLLRGVEQEIERKQARLELPAAVNLPQAELPPMLAQPEALVPALQASEACVFASAEVLTPVLPADTRLVCLTDQGSLAAEKYRVLGLKLRNMRERRKLKRIVITSSIPGEGKSLTAANLALNQSRSKVLRTVLIDGDLRRPELANRFGFGPSLAGLSDLLRGDRHLSEVVYKIGGTSLWFVPAGTIPENPMEIMQSSRMRQTLEQLDAFFDWMIIDTPPVTPLADTPLWMKLADGVLLVTREGVSEKKQLERAVDVIDRSTMLGVVVNSCNCNGQQDYYSRYQPPTKSDE